MKIFLILLGIVVALGGIWLSAYLFATATHPAYEVAALFTGMALVLAGSITAMNAAEDY